MGSRDKETQVYQGVIMKAVRFLLVSLLCCQLSVQAMAETSPVSQPIVTYKSSSRYVTQLSLQCLESKEGACQLYNVLQETVVKKDGSILQSKIVLDSISKEGLAKKFDATLIHSDAVFEKGDPIQSVMGAVLMPAGLVVLSLFFPPLWAAVPFSLILAGGALLALPLALVAEGINSASYQSKVNRWKSVVAQVNAGKEVKRPLRLRKSQDLGQLVELLGKE